MGDEKFQRVLALAGQPGRIYDFHLAIGVPSVEKLGNYLGGILKICIHIDDDIALCQSHPRQDAFRYAEVVRHVYHEEVALDLELRLQDFGGIIRRRVVDENQFVAVDRPAGLLGPHYLAQTARQFGQNAGFVEKRKYH